MTWVQSLDWEDPLEKEMAAHSSILENPMDRKAWWATVHGVPKRRTCVREHTRSTYIRGKTPGKRQPNKRKDGSFWEKEEEEV